MVGVLMLAFAACSGGAPPPQETVNRGQALDQDTGQPIAGVIVVGRYRGSRGLEGATSCNRVETAVSDELGWFELPLDPEAGPLAMEGYHRDYRHGWPVRVPTCGINGDSEQCQIWQDRRDSTGNVVSIVKEPTIYHGRTEAAKAAGYGRDLYLKRFEGTREERLRELWRLTGANSCLGPPKTSRGLQPFLEAILQEQIALGDLPGKIESTNGYIEAAKDALRQKK
jgi:hypothetical protein